MNKAKKTTADETAALTSHNLIACAHREGDPVPYDAKSENLLCALFMYHLKTDLALEGQVTKELVMRAYANIKTVSPEKLKKQFEKVMPKKRNDPFAEAARPYTRADADEREVIHRALLERLERVIS